MEVTSGGPRGPQESAGQRGRGHTFSEMFWAGPRRRGTATPEACSGKAQHGHAPGRALVRATGGASPSRTVCTATASTERALRGKRGVAHRCWGLAWPRGDQWERPVAGLGVHHMAWPANMQSRREHHCASPQTACEPKDWPPNPNPNPNPNPPSLPPCPPSLPAPSLSSTGILKYTPPSPLVRVRVTEVVYLATDFTPPFGGPRVASAPWTPQFCARTQPHTVAGLCRLSAERQTGPSVRTAAKWWRRSQPISPGGMRAP